MTEIIPGARRLQYPKFKRFYLLSRSAFMQSLFHEISKVSLQLSSGALAHPYIYIMKQIETSRMKTKSLYLATMLFIGVAATAVAKEVPASASLAVVSVKGSEVVKVIYKGVTAGKVKVNIYNAASEIVFSENRNTPDGFILPLNFSGLQSGEYTIEIVDAAGAKSEKINYQPELSTGTVRVAKLDAQGKFLLSVSNNAADDITVRIFDEFNNLVHTSNQQINGSFAQVYAIKNFTGACTFEVTDAQGKTTVARF
jgi:hypothetical protein